MKSRTMLGGIAAAVLATSLPATASNTDEAQQEVREPTPVERQSAQNQALAHKMMGHINLAQLALDLGLVDEAGDQVRDARNLETALAAEMPQLMLRSTFKYGKVTHDETSTLTEHYIPVVDDVFLVGDYEAVLKGKKAADINETSAGIRHVGIAVDLREVDEALAKAAAALADEKPVDASAALNDVFKGAIYDEEETDDPKLAILENLALARSFIDHGRYDSARLTLKYAADRVNLAKKTELSSIDDESLSQFTSDLKAIRQKLREKDPTLSERISDRLSNWSATVKGWFG